MNAFLIAAVIIGSVSCYGPHSGPFNPFSSAAESYSSFTPHISGNSHSFGQSYFGNAFPNAQQLVGTNQFAAAGRGAHPPNCTPLTPTNCAKSRYRTLDGTCNNLQNPIWGVANGKYSRLLTAKYGDGVGSPTLSVTGQVLPNARTVSLVAFGEQRIQDPLFTLVNMQFGQIITHDMSMQSGGTQSRRHPTRCCTQDRKIFPSTQTANKQCYPILTPTDIDPIHQQTGTTCSNFVRTLTDRDNGCPGVSPNQPAEQLTTVTSFLDLSLVYGNSAAQNQPIRAFQRGRMIVETKQSGDFPPQTPNVTTDCDVQSNNEICYLTGDARVNQNPGLTILQITLLREHNRLADVLGHINSHWDDETLFQEARRINVAQYQNIVYYEWLPIFLGTDNMLKNRLIYKTTPGSYVNDYDASIDPSVINSHATAAFRYFHTQIVGLLEVVTEERTSTNTLRLSDWLNRPAILESGDNYNSLTRGLTTQPEDLTDKNLDAEIKHFLFRRGRQFGGDLKALDIQRNRDHGLAGYNDFREFCGLRRASSWEDYLDLISPRDLQNLQSLYSSHEDVDLTVGGALEAHVDGALAGPTFLCILTEQFYRTRVGDRFFFERGDPELGFSRPQLKELRKASMARLLCDNTQNLQSNQQQAFLRISAQNPLLSCDQIPEVDLSEWQDFAGAGSSEQYDHEFYSHNYKK